MSAPYFSKENALILMDTAKANATYYTADELKAMADAGIRTAMIFDTAWGDVETRWGHYEWGKLDERVALLNRCGMRAIVKWHCAAPAWFPSDWWACASGGPIVGVISPWCNPAQAYERAMSAEVCRRYNDERLGNLVINSQSGHGESVMPTVPCWFDSYATAAFKHSYGADAKLYYPNPNGPIVDKATSDFLFGSYLAMLQLQAEVFIDNPWRLLYSAFHPCFIDILHWDCTGNQWLPDILRLYKTMGAQTFQVYYNWVGYEQYWGGWAKLKQNYGTLVFGGAEYCAGLRGLNSTRLAIEQGLTGQVIGPCHGLNGMLEVTPEMLKEIRWAAQEWQLS
jgi:hypothetical protein